MRGNLRFVEGDSQPRTQRDGQTAVLLDRGGVDIFVLFNEQSTVECQFGELDMREHRRSGRCQMKFRRPFRSEPEGRTHHGVYPGGLGSSRDLFSIRNSAGLPDLDI